MGNNKSHDSLSDRAWEIQQIISHGPEAIAKPPHNKKPDKGIFRENHHGRLTTASRTPHHESVDARTCDKRTFPWASSPVPKSNLLEPVAPLEKSLEKNFCDICVECFSDSSSSHGSSLNHKTIRENLLRRMYPFRCPECPMRFRNYQDRNSHQCLGPSQEFDPFCCFLCLLTFRTGSLGRVHMLSVEHEQKRKLGLDIAQRKQLVVKKVNFNTVSTQTDNDISLNNPTFGTSSQSQSEHSNDKNYFCCPCSAIVPKSNVITHEQGRKHKKSCVSWVSNLSSKSSLNDKPLKSTNQKDPSKESATEPEKMESLIIWESEVSKNTNLSYISKLMEDFNARESENDVQTFGQRHEDSKSTNNSSSVQPTNGTSCGQNTIITSVMESLFEVNSGNKGSDGEKHNPTLAVPLQQFNNLNLGSNQESSITKAQSDNSNIPNCSKKLGDEYGGRLKCETSTCSSGSKDLSEIESGNPASESEHPEDKNEMAYQRKQEISLQLTHSSKLHGCPNESKEAFDDLRNNSEGIQEDIIETLEEYFMIDRVIMTKHKPISTFNCTYCGAPTCIMQNMVAHVLSKSHRKIMWDQSIKQLERKLQILTFLRQVGNKNKILKGMQRVMLKTIMQEIEELITAGRKIINERFPSPKTTSLPPIAQESFNSVEEKSDNEEEYCVGKTIVIGNSNLVSLQEEAEQACEGIEIDDFEYECETCGVVIEIFNNDVDLSMDMHIQNDPQHQLATAVPVERDAQKMAEMSKTFVMDKASKFARSKTSVIEEILQLEHKFVDLKPHSLYCMLCSVDVKRSLAVHHFLSKKHMTDKWAGSYSDVELQQKCSVLSSLKKCNFAVGMLNGAVVRIRQFLFNRLQQSSNSSPCQDQNSAVGTKTSNADAVITSVQQSKPTEMTEVFCPTCKENITAYEKKTRRQHRKTCYKAFTQNMLLSQSPKSSNTKNPKSSQTKTFFCDICNRTMAAHTRNGHMSGKAHKVHLANKMAIKKKSINTA